MSLPKDKTKIESYKIKISISKKKWYCNHEHPRGSLGKNWKLSDITKKNMSNSAKSFYENNPYSKRGFQKGHKTNIGRKIPGVSESNKRRCGEKSSTWCGGLSFVPYTKEFNRKFKQLIRERDNYICLKCGKQQNQQKKKLTIHHINYDKAITTLKNCCSLCTKCNTEVNFNRHNWQRFFQILLSEKYKYQYKTE